MAKNPLNGLFPATISNLLTKATKRLPSETIGLGEQALLSCHALSTDAAIMIEDNLMLMRGDRRIRLGLAHGKSWPDASTRKTGAQKPSAKDAV